MFRSKLFYLVLIFAAVMAGETSAETRVALVIGNGAYQKAGALRNPPNDARAMADMIKRMGFESTDVTYDRDYIGFRNDLRQFAAKAREADVALVYFAGHGIEIGGENYLIPTDAILAHEDDVRYEAVLLDEVLHAVRSARKLRVVILDACRNNPFASRMIRRGGGTRGGSGGLAPIETTGDVLVAYAAKHGTTASDGAGDNSPYAEALLRHMPTPGLDIRIMLGRVRDQVLQATRQGQEPFIYGSVGGQYIYLTTSALADVGPPPYQKERWVYANGPYQSAPHSFAIDANTADVLYAGLDEGRLQRSLDGGRSWAPLGEAAPTQHKLSAVGSVGGSQYLLLGGTTGAFFIKRSDVSPWEKIAYFDKLAAANVRAIATSARQPGLIYAASGEHTSGVTAGVSVAAAASGQRTEGQPVQIEWKEQPFEGGNVHRSLDGGRSWTTGALPITNAMAIAPGNPAIVVAGTSDQGVFATADGGLNWRRFNCLGKRYVSQQVAVSAHNPMRAAVATDKGAFAINLDTEPYCQRLGSFDDSNAIAWSRKNASRLLVGTDNGVFESLDGGASFRPYSEGLMHKRVLGLFVTQDETVVARVDLAGIATRGERDGVWSAAVSQFSRGGVGAMAFDASGNLYAGTVAGPVVSENLGSTFRSLLPSGSEVMAIATIASGGGNRGGQAVSWSAAATILVGTQGGAIFRSVDSGANWKQVFKQTDSIWSIAADRTRGMLLAAAGKTGVVVSTDAGASWKRVDGLASNHVVSMLAVEGIRAYAGTADGHVFVSDADGRVWKPAGIGLPQKPVLGLAFGSGTPARIWAAMEGGGVYALEEGSGQWKPRNDNLDNMNMIAIAVDPVEPTHVYVAGHSGVHVSRDNGASWTKLVEGFQRLRSINTLAFSPDGRILFAGENGGLHGLIVR